MPEIFLSHSAKDKVVAAKICQFLENQNLSCWVAPRNIRPGCSWSDAIVEGIDTCKVMVIVLSPHSDVSGHVKREVELCISRGKPIIPFLIEEFSLSPSMEYCLNHCQRLDATAPPLSSHLEPLARAVRDLLKIGQPVQVGKIPRFHPRAKTWSSRSIKLVVICGGFIVLMMSSLGFWLISGRDRNLAVAGPPVVNRGPSTSSVADAPPRPVESPPEPEPTDSRSRAILLKLEERIWMLFENDTPLDDVLKYIRASTQDDVAGLPDGIPIYVDPQALLSIDKTLTSATISINLEGVPLKETLKLILAQVGLKYTVKNGLLKIVLKD